MKRVSEKRMASYQEEAEIYNLLVQEFPHLFLALDRIPRELEHPGNQPRSPERILKATIQILPEDNFETLVEKFKDVQHYRELERFVAYIDKQILNQASTDTIESVLDDDGMYDDDDDRNDWYDRYRDHYTPPVYGDPKAIVLTFCYQDPAYKEKWVEYNHELKNWEDRIVQRRARNEVIAAVIAQNLNRINQARGTYHDLWVMAARKLKGESDSGWVQKKVESLEQQLEILKGQLKETPE